MTTRLGTWARSGGAPIVGPFRTIEADYERTGGARVWGEPLRRDLAMWTFADGCIVFDPRTESARQVRARFPLPPGS